MEPWGTHLARGGKAAQAAIRDQPAGSSYAAEDEVHTASHDVGERGGDPAVRYGGDAHPGTLAKQLPCEMRHGAGARRGEGQRLTPCSTVRDELGK
jgi:hypothetical protein